jgi:hypothetical protein
MGRCFRTVYNPTFLPYYGMPRGCLGCGPSGLCAVVDDLLVAFVQFHGMAV